MRLAQALEHAWLKETKSASTKNLFAGMKEGDDAGAEASSQGGEGVESMHSSFVDFNLDRKARRATPRHAVPRRARRAMPAKPAPCHARRARPGAARRAPRVASAHAASCASSPVQMGAGMAKLTEIFGLEAGAAKLKKSKCALVNNPGQLYVTTNDLCFLGVSKKEKIPIKDITTVAKAKRFKLSPGSGHALHITAGGTKYEFNGFTEREDTLTAIKEAASAKGVSITFED